MAADKDIYVVRPDLPDLDEVLPMLREIWDRRILTNAGPFHEQFEERMRDYLGVPAATLVANGTVALESAIAAAQLSGEVITTPYSFVATTHSIVRSKLTPVFVDVRPDDLTIDPARIEAAITPQTSAILAVHVYGFPCAVEEIETIAQKHGLKVIYDAAHAFGVTLKGRPIAQFGDFSTFSFHATKVFSTFEGGAVATNHPDALLLLKHFRNFGIESETAITAVGTNAKMSEFGAAIGLLQMERIDMVREERAKVSQRYFDGLAENNLISFPRARSDAAINHSYFPILIAGEGAENRDKVYNYLKERKIYSRRYFYPYLADLDIFAEFNHPGLGVGRHASERILCLPIYPGLDPADQDRIIELIHEACHA